MVVHFGESVEEVHRQGEKIYFLLARLRLR